ncbi:prepilin peptidase [Halalkalibacter oceani]|uniref:Prepilin leader peptidase/N-methyltransferase n=1 Tax=Halalkalibacter oceani TaxID=1653776 RepID=A0A9X2DTA3_9BACI|nr:A24 family peptidase [Halalkalibacter oceani]MCM3715092.1 prepilin peptidase [Halalkalibacter oceani]
MTEVERLVMLYLFLVGCIVGSFYNVVGLRLPVGESIVKPRSQCPVCGHRLSAWELVPLLSYMCLRGRCRVCRAVISPLYPAVELGTGLLFALSFYVYRWTGDTLLLLVLVSLLAIIFVSDVRYMLIPDRVLLFFTALILLLRLCFLPSEPWWDAFLGAIAGFALLYIIAIVSRGGMGGGDVKLFGVLGLILGWQHTLLAFFLSCLSGALLGGAALVIGKVERRKPVPFGPFIVLGAITAYFFGESLVEWYMRRIG